MGAQMNLARRYCKLSAFSIQRSAWGQQAVGHASACPCADRRLNDLFAAACAAPAVLLTRWVRKMNLARRYCKLLAFSIQRSAWGRQDVRHASDCPRADRRLNQVGQPEACPTLEGA